MYSLKCAVSCSENSNLHYFIGHVDKAIIVVNTLVTIWQFNNNTNEYQLKYRLYHNFESIKQSNIFAYDNSVLPDVIFCGDAYERAKREYADPSDVKYELVYEPNVPDEIRFFYRIASYAKFVE
jgi:hypothetical protein